MCEFMDKDSDLVRSHYRACHNVSTDFRTVLHERGAPHIEEGGADFYDVRSVGAVESGYVVGGALLDPEVVGVVVVIGGGGGGGKGRNAFKCYLRGLFGTSICENIAS